MIAAAADAPYLDYHVRWRTGEQRPGKHPARHAGAGGHFRGYRPFWQLPDARHIDVRRSIVDPNGDIVVRQLEQRSSITLVVAADVSRSMDVGTSSRRLLSVTNLARSAARSAARAGDSFGFLAFDERVRDELCLAPTRRRSAAIDLVSLLRRFVAEGRSAAGMANLAAHLPMRRCLVLLAADFLMPLDDLGIALASLARHDVVPIVLGDSLGLAWPRTGLLRVRDSETGGTRLLLMRPALQRRRHDAAVEHRAQLDAVFQRHGRTAFHASGPIDIDAVSRHLMGT